MYLNCHTYYSLRFGTFSEKELLELAQQNGVEEMVLTDVNNTSACLNFIRLAPKYGVRPVVGIDFRNGAKQHFIGIAKNNEGFLELNNYLSNFLHNKEAIPDRAQEMNHAYIIYPYKRVTPAVANDLKDFEYIGVTMRDLTYLHLSPMQDYQHKMVVVQPVTFRSQKDFNIHRLLRAIDNNTILSKLTATEEANKNEVMHARGVLENYFAAYPTLIRNTKILLKNCSIHFDFSKNRQPQNQQNYFATAAEDVAHLQQLCFDGLEYRYGRNVSEAVLQRLEKELEIVAKMNFVSYFLINHDIVRYAQHKNYFYVGRGSGANSIIAYLLRITDVDPIELDLYFERFINLYRVNPPDFDIDFSWREREDVTRYIFHRFDNTSLLATYNTFQYKAAVRELGKVFGLPKHEIDTLSSGKFELKQLDEINRLVLQYGNLLNGMPNHLGIHAGGVLIAEKPIHYFSATNIPPKGFATTQFDMLIAEDVGLYKFDILGQRGLAKIKDAIQIIKKNKPEAKLDIHDVKKFKEDPKINQVIKEARCMGCFYVESPAMRMLLKKLEVDNYLGLVAASSIIRPGVAQSGMMREYILRHKDPERIKDGHPAMLKIMPDTYGIMVYQEDVIKVAHLFAGLDLGEADVLRRGMSGKFRSRDEFEIVKDKFFSNCKERGYEDTVTAEVWRQISSFAGYAFAKGHSASYAVESYQTLFLKTYYPLEYMVAILNNGGGFYRSQYYVHEARMLGGVVHAPCVNVSAYETTLEGNNIYLGFAFIEGFGFPLSEQIEANRKAHGAFQSLSDFVERITIGLEHLSTLIRAGGFVFTKKNKRALLWEAHALLHKGDEKSAQPLLFKEGTKEFELPQLGITSLETAFDQMELFGFSLIDPFLLLEKEPHSRVAAADLAAYEGKVIEIYGYLVSTKQTKTKGHKLMKFGTFIDRAGTFFDTTHFPNVAAKYPFRGRGIYLIKAMVAEEFGFYSLEVVYQEKVPLMPDPRYDDSKLGVQEDVIKISKSN